MLALLALLLKADPEIMAISSRLSMAKDAYFLFFG